MAGTVSAQEVVAGLVTDLGDEAETLAQILDSAPDDVWSLPTPADRWTVRDQVAHLGHFDGVARRAIASPDRFVQFRDDLADLQTYVDAVGSWHADRSGEAMLRWWREENRALCSAASSADPTVRVPWFGPSMSLASKLTARIMETWAHGQDVVDALGVDRTPTDRLKHVARIGVLAYPNSFRVRDRPTPTDRMRVELLGPGGDPWTWGDEDSPDVVRGTALDFCLVVTQRRHVDDTSIETVGDAAREWMLVAQAFAGDPGPGRRPGQFSTPTG